MYCKSDGIFLIRVRKVKSFQAVTDCTLHERGREKLHNESGTGLTLRHVPAEDVGAFGPGQCRVQSSPSFVIRRKHIHAKRIDQVLNRRDIIVSRHSRVQNSPSFVMVRGGKQFHGQPLAIDGKWQPAPAICYRRGRGPGALLNICVSKIAQNVHPCHKEDSTRHRAPPRCRRPVLLQPLARGKHLQIRSVGERTFHMSTLILNVT